MEHFESQHNKCDTRIPCDVCFFTATNINQFKIHVNQVHLNKVKGVQKENNSRMLKQCGQCAFNATDMKQIDRHVKDVHMERTPDATRQTFTHNSGMFRKQGTCRYWKYGNCKFSAYNCRFEHLADNKRCKYQEKCYRIDCRFYHDNEQQRFPFLGAQNSPQAFNKIYNYQNSPGPFPNNVWWREYWHWKRNIKEQDEHLRRM